MTKILSCIIVDDEDKDRENLRMLIDIYCPEIEIIGEARDKETTEKILTEFKPDIVFLDIQLGNHSIFEILNRLENIYFHIVFVTAYDKYAIKGYQYDAIDYLLKPINPIQLERVKRKLLGLKKESSLKKQFSVDLKSNDEKLMNNQFISLIDNKGVNRINIQDIIYCNSDNNYTVFHLENTKKMVISKNLKHFEAQLKKYNFFRIHKSYLINLSKVQFIKKGQKATVAMKNGSQLPVSRLLKKSFYMIMGLIE